MAAGAFNIKNDHVDDHQAYLRAVIKKMFTICKKGMAISFKTLLSDEGKARGYMAYDPVDILDYALTLSRLQILIMRSLMDLLFCIFINNPKYITPRSLILKLIINNLTIIEFIFLKHKDIFKQVTVLKHKHSHIFCLYGILLLVKPHISLSKVS